MRLTKRCKQALNDEMTKFKKFIEIALKEKKKTKGGYSQSVYDIYEDEELYQMADKLASYEDAEEQGLLLRLPCKVGDTVFFSTNFDDGMENCIINTVIDSIKINIVNHEEEIVFESLNLYKFTINNFGKTVFLTREEAEKALADMGV